MRNMKMLSLITVCLVAFSGWTESTEDRVKDWISNQSEALKRGVDQFGEDLRAAQDYLDHYHWKGIIEEEASSGPATLKHLELNGHSKAFIARPGEEIGAEVQCDLDPEQCSLFGFYRIVVGIKGEGPQAVIGNESGFTAGKTREEFTLVAPSNPGIYQIRFKTIDAFTKTGAFDSWKDDEGNEPDGTATIGLIIVK